jgi:hypothetical protein
MREYGARRSLIEDFARFPPVGTFSLHLMQSAADPGRAWRPMTIAEAAPPEETVNGCIQAEW